MNEKSLRFGCLSVLPGIAMSLAMGCSGKLGPGTSAGDLRSFTDSTHTSRKSEPSVSIRFAIELHRGVPGPIYVLLNAEDGQLGWVKVFRDGERIYFRERCEIEDCGEPPAVCGAAVPLIRNIAAGKDPRTVEFVWDGMTSVPDPLSGCETRQPAPPGGYIARFCFSSEAEFEGNRDPSRTIPGRPVQATCVEKEFTLDEEQVVLSI